MMNRDKTQQAGTLNADVLKVVSTIYIEKQWDHSVNEMEQLSYLDFESILIKNPCNEDPLSAWRKSIKLGYFTETSKGISVEADIYKIRERMAKHDSVKKGLIELDPSCWSDKKIRAYRKSLRRHHDQIIESMYHMKNMSLGIISALILGLTIVWAYALPNAENPQLSSQINSTQIGQAYDALTMTTSILVLSLVFFMMVLYCSRRPTIFFSLEQPICGIESTENVGTMNNFHEFYVTMLKYEVHEFTAQEKINRYAKRYFSVGQAIATVGIFLLAFSIMLLYAPTKDSEIAQALANFSGRYAILFSPLIFIGISIFVAIIVAFFTFLNTRRIIKSITKSEENAKKKSLDERAEECIIGGRLRWEK